MIIKETLAIPGFLGKPDFWFCDKNTGRLYRRIYAGIHWTGGNPGAVAVVAEELEKDATLDEHKLWVLAEYESRALSAILTRCQELRKSKEVEKFFGDTSNRPLMTLKRRSGAEFSLSKAPFVDEANSHKTYLSLIREKASATRRVLNFEEFSGLPSKLGQLNTIPSGDSFRSDYPQVAALGYALAALVVYSFKKQVYHPEVRYGPLDPLVGM